MWSRILNFVRLVIINMSQTSNTNFIGLHEVEGYAQLLWPNSWICLYSCSTSLTRTAAKSLASRPCLATYFAVVQPRSSFVSSEIRELNLHLRSGWCSRCLCCRKGPSDSPSFPIALVYRLSLIICAVIPRAIDTPCRSALSFCARAGWMIARTLHISLFKYQTQPCGHRPDTWSTKWAFWGPYNRQFWLQSSICPSTFWNYSNSQESSTLPKLVEGPLFFTSRLVIFLTCVTWKTLIPFSVRSALTSSHAVILVDDCHGGPLVQSTHCISGNLTPPIGVISNERT